MFYSEITKSGFELSMIIDLFKPSFIYFALDDMKITQYTSIIWTFNIYFLIIDSSATLYLTGTYAPNAFITVFITVASIYIGYDLNRFICRIVMLDLYYSSQMVCVIEGPWHTCMYP